MIYIRTENGRITFTHYMPFDPVYGLGKTEEELKKTGYLVEVIPEYAGEVPARPFPGNSSTCPKRPTPRRRKSQLWKPSRPPPTRRFWG